MKYNEKGGAWFWGLTHFGPPHISPAVPTDVEAR